MKSKRLRLYILFLVLFLSFAFTSEIYGGVKDDEWKPVDPKELALKESKVEKNADAEAIFWDVTYDMNFLRSVKTNTYVRIKIFTERGRDEYSKIKILNPPNTKVSDIAARVIKPDGTIIEINKTDIFDSTIIQTNKLAIKAKSIVVPNLEVGSILEYRYKEELLGWNFRAVLEFQKEIPTQSITNCAKLEGSRGTSDISKNHFTNMGQIEFVKNEDFYCATKQNVPSFHVEPFMPPEERMKPWVQIGSISVIEGKKEDDEKAYWAKSAGFSYQTAKPYIEPNEEIKKTAVQIIGDAKTDEEKLMRLFEYCKTQIKNVDLELTKDEKERIRFFFASPASETLKRKSGRGRDIDYLFFALATSLGFDARIARTGNRENYQPFSKDKDSEDKYPSLGASCVAVIIGNKVFYCSPAEFYIPMGMLSWKMEGQKSILIGPKSYLWHNTAPPDPDKSVEKRIGKFKLSEDGTLEGNVSIEFTGHIGQDYKEANDKLTQAEREAILNETIKGKFNNALVTNIRVENAQDPIKNFTYTFNVRIPNYAQVSGKRLFIQPNFFEYGSGALFITSTRIHPIFFRYAWSEDDEIEIELPQGFQLEKESINRVTVTSHFVGADEVRADPSEDGKFLKYKRKFKFGTNGKLLYEVNLYNTLKTFFESTHKNATQLVTLKKLE